MPNGFARGLCGKGDYASQKKEVAIDFSLTPEAAAYDPFGRQSCSQEEQ